MLLKNEALLSESIRRLVKPKVYLLTGEGCVVAVRIGRRRGSVDEGLRRRRRRPLLVGCCGVRVMRRVMRCMVTEAACTTKQKATVTRCRRHIVVVVLVHSSKNKTKKKMRKNSRLELRDENSISAIMRGKSAPK